MKRSCWSSYMICLFWIISIFYQKYCQPDDLNKHLTTLVSFYLCILAGTPFPNWFYHLYVFGTTGPSVVDDILGPNSKKLRLCFLSIARLLSRFLYSTYWDDELQQLLWHFKMIENSDNFHWEYFEQIGDLVLQTPLKEQFNFH